MRKRFFFGLVISGLAAGLINGLFGGGGGMVLVPLLTWLTDLKETEIFPVSISVILPVCVASIVLSANHMAIPWVQSSPYLAGSLLGGLAAGKWGAKIPVRWLHRLLGILVLWGGIRYLC